MLLPALLATALILSGCDWDGGDSPEPLRTTEPEATATEQTSAGDDASPGPTASTEPENLDPQEVVEQTRMSVAAAESFSLEFEVSLPGGSSSYRLEWKSPDKVYMIVTGAEPVELAQQGDQVFVKEPTGQWVEVPDAAATLPVPDWNQEFGLLLLGNPLELLGDTTEQGLPAYHIRAQLSGREYLEAVSQLRNSDFQQNLADAGVEQVHAIVDFFISKKDFLPRRQVATVLVAGGGQQASLRVEAFYGQFNEPINFPNDLPLPD